MWISLKMRYLTVKILMSGISNIVPVFRIGCFSFKYLFFYNNFMQKYFFFY